MLSMLDIDNVCVLASHSICILFLYVSDRHIVCHFCIWSSVICISFDTSLPFTSFACQLMPITLGW